MDKLIFLSHGTAKNKIYPEPNVQVGSINRSLDRRKNGSAPIDYHASLVQNIDSRMNSIFDRNPLSNASKTNPFFQDNDLP